MSKINILILEDVSDDAELIKSTLQKDKINFNAKVVAKKEDFTQALTEYKPDIILSDFDLITFDGFTALAIVKKMCPEVPVIFVTGTLGEERSVEALKCGATDYVLKNRLFKLSPAVQRALEEAKEKANHKKAEEKIREQAELLDITTDAIYVSDLESKILFWNKGAEELYEYKKEEVIGKNIFNLKIYQNDAICEETLKVIFGEGKWRGEVEQYSKTKRKIIADSRWTLVKNEQGNPKAILVVNTDLTDKKKLEAQFLHTQRMESIGTLASGVAHDLNNVLTPILMSIGLLQKNIKEEANLKILNTLEISARRGADIVKQVLTFSRGEEGKKINVQLKHLINEIEKILKETFPKHIQVKTNIYLDLWTILADPTQMHQILLNLCLNAVDAMPNGGMLSITAENVILDEHYVKMNFEVKQEGPYVLIKVEDTGTGIPPKILAKIFEPFFTTKEIGKGTGLGLSTVYAIVKKHQGFVNVYSEVGKGTEFKIYLPALQSTETILEEKKQSFFPQGEGQLILVVDDEASIREITTFTLEANGYKVITASDGAEAVVSFVQHKEEISLAFVDMFMPIMDGRATIKALRKIKPAVKIIATSGLKENEKMTADSSVEADVFLQKPYTAEKLLKSINKLLQTT